MSELDLNQITELASNLRAVSDETYSAAVAVADVYNTTSSYDIGDYCIKSTLLYKCNTAIPNGEVWNSNHWDEICVSDELNEIRSSVIHVGTSAPSNPNVQLWLDTDEPGMSSVSSVNGATGTVILDADDVGAMSGWVLLWTNASPNSSFDAQTITLDLSAYNFVFIEFRSLTSDLGSDYTYSGGISGIDGLIHLYKDGNGWTNGFYGFGQRGYIPSSTGIEFKIGIAQTAWSNMTQQNKMAIPYKIYGIKGVTA